ncbi:MAG: serine/threonine protein kinase [Candidatus Aminicenantes bacterium]|nr:serine/threonine protein kinase [Candidatus Aminicenantes bacterium]
MKKNAYSNQRTRGRIVTERTTIGKYKLLSILGKGAMGIVYKAFDPGLNREVAVKTLHFESLHGTSEQERSDALKRFMNEARAAAKLDHSNIVTVYDVFQQEKESFIVMQYIVSQSLQEILAAGKKYTMKEISSLVTPICDALDSAHKKGIVHRDIKPANILIDEEGKPFIADFGIARIETSNLTSTGTTPGTPSYMSPEQIKGEKVDGRSDLFSLGVILYELMAGKKPFRGQDLSTVA